MKNRDDVTERRKGKGRQRQALIAGWQTSKARKESAGLRWHTKRGKLHQQPLQCVGAWWAAGGGCCRYRRRTFNLHSLLSLEGVQPHHAPTFITRRSSLGGGGWGVGRCCSCNLNLGSSAKQTSCSQDWKRRRKGKKLELHIQHNQDKQNTVLQDDWGGGDKGEHTYCTWMMGPVRKHGMQVEQGHCRGRKDFPW